jgi:aminoglycoside 3-N-acetyltransferase
MHKTTLSDIKKILNNIPINTTEPLVFVHSSLFPFGIIENGVSGICQTLIDWIGPNGTLMMPTFTFKKHECWHQQNTPSETGILTEYFRKLPGARRTIHPIHSVAVYGKQAEYLSSEIDSSSFGEKSIFAKIFKLKATNISLGTEFEGGTTYLHYIEELFKVPYRDYIEINTKVLDSKSFEIDKSFTYFARIKKENFEWDNNWSIVLKDLISRNLINLHKVGPAKIMHSNMHETGLFFLNQLSKNPLYCAINTEFDSCKNNSI